MIAAGFKKRFGKIRDSFAPRSMVFDMAWMLAALFKKCFGKIGDSLPILSKDVRFGFDQFDLRFVRRLASRPEVPESIPPPQVGTVAGMARRAAGYCNSVIYFLIL